MAEYLFRLIFLKGVDPGELFYRFRSLSELFRT